MANMNRRVFLQFLGALAVSAYFAGCGGGGSSSGGGGGGGGSTTVGAATRSATSVGDDNSWPQWGGSLFKAVGPVSGNLNYAPFQSAAADAAPVSSGTSINWTNGSSSFAVQA